jgi:hypothetical protein
VGGTKKFCAVGQIFFIGNGSFFIENGKFTKLGRTFSKENSSFTKLGGTFNKESLKN